MEIIVTRLIESIIFPPGLFLLLIAIGLLLPERAGKIKKILLVWSGLIFLYLASTPFCMLKLAGLTETVPAMISLPTLGETDKAAIVVLSGGRNTLAPEYQGDTVDSSTLERMRYGAWLYNKTEWPLVVTGGTPLGEEISLARLMADSYQTDFGIADVWLEEKSRTTHDHGVYVPPIAREKGINTLVLVTHASHMPRAVRSFRKSGLTIIPAPTAFTTPGSMATGYAAWRPSAGAMQSTVAFLHELVGRLWYRIRH